MPVAFQILHRFFIIVLIIGVAVGMTLYVSLQGSLPQREGIAVVENLNQKIDIRRDASGLPSIESTDRESVLFGLGFVHAQDQFLSMDLLRRSSVGRLSELLGHQARSADQQRLYYGLDAVTQQMWQQASAQEQALLTAYSNGVNAGLKQLSQVPIFYGLRHLKPEPWQPQDAIRVLLSLVTLPHEANLLVALSQEALREAATATQAPSSSSPMLLGIQPTYVRELSATDAGLQLEIQSTSLLPLQAPWYPVRWRTFAQSPWTQGVTLPGLPTLLMGRHDGLAWSLHAATEPPFQWLRLQVDGEQFWHPEEGWTDFIYQTLPLPWDGATQVLRQTPWGPVLGADDNDQWLVLAWPGLAAQADSMAWLHLDQQRDTPSMLSSVEPPIGTELIMLDTTGTWAIRHDLTRAQRVLEIQPEGVAPLMPQRQPSVLQGQRLSEPILMSAPSTLLGASKPTMPIAEQPHLNAWRLALSNQLQASATPEFNRVRTRLLQAEALEWIQHQWQIEFIDHFRQAVLTQLPEPELNRMPELHSLFRAPYHALSKEAWALAHLNEVQLPPQFWQHPALQRPIDAASASGDWPRLNNPPRSLAQHMRFDRALQTSGRDALWLHPLSQPTLALPQTNPWQPEFQLTLVLNDSAADRIAGSRWQTWHPLQPYLPNNPAPQPLMPGPTRYQLTLLPGR